MIEVLLGAGIVWAGQIVWAFTQRMKRPKLVAPSKPSCQCRHTKSLHKGGTGECQGGFTEFGNKPVDHTGYKRCRCTNYVGPEPLPEFYAPELHP